MNDGVNGVARHSDSEVRETGRARPADPAVVDLVHVSVGEVVGPGRLEIIDESGLAPTTTWSPPTLTSLGAAPGHPTLRLHRPLPTAAFSQRDALLPGYLAAEIAAQRHGFAPVKRTVGGRMAPLHEDTLVIDLIAAHPQPNAATRRRFAETAGIIAEALLQLDVPARIGELPGEYCPGDYSVNAAGRVKLAGVAQRVTRWGFLVSTVLVLARPDPLREVVEACYGALAIPVDPTVVGAISDYAVDVPRADVVTALIEQFARRRPWLV